MRSRVASLEANRREVESREQALPQQLNSQQRPDSVAQIPQQQSPPSERAPVIASFLLMPGLSRDQSRVPQLTLNPSAQIANIEIQLEPRDEFPRFRAELRTRSGEDVFVASSLRRRRTGGAFSVSVGLPADSLSPGEYEIALKGIRADKSVEDVGYYYFSVRKH